MTTASDVARNETPEDSEANLRRDFELALADAMKGPAVNASMLDVVRKYLADRDADRRWQQERESLVPPDDQQQQPDPLAGRRLPFPVHRPALDTEQTTQASPGRDIGPLSRGNDFGFAAG